VLNKVQRHEDVSCA